MAIDTAGPLLEGRAHRLFLAQGSFAERGLIPSATADRRMQATDIDVLVSEYVSGFHLTRRHIECKAGKYPLLDRVLWLHGVRALLHADSSYLIASDADLTASDFARSLDVQLFTSQHLDTWEKSLGIASDVWPCRSDYQTFDAARAAWSTAINAKYEDEAWKLLKAALVFVDYESWLTFRYRHLNKLLRLIPDVATRYQAGGLHRDQQLCARYAFSALLVRLAQYMLAICADVGSILPVDLDKYLFGRLTFGDQDPNQATQLVKATVAWVKSALELKNIRLPPEIDAGRLNAPPPYAPEVVQLVRKLLDQSYDARYLPIAVERLQFGSDSDDQLPRLRAAAGAGESLAVLLKAFVMRTFAVPKTLADPMRADLTAAYLPSRTAGATTVSVTPAGTPPPSSPGGRTPAALSPKRKTARGAPAKAVTEKAASNDAATKRASSPGLPDLLPTDDDIKKRTR